MDEKKSTKVIPSNLWEYVTLVAQARKHNCNEHV
jgi:hypothetical protein